MAIVAVAVTVFLGIAIYYGRIVPFVAKHSRFDKRFLLSTYGCKVLRKYFDLCKKHNRTPWEGYLYYTAIVVGFVAVFVDWVAY